VYSTIASLECGYKIDADDPSKPSADTRQGSAILLYDMMTGKKKLILLLSKSIRQQLTTVLGGGVVN
jgi:hypothetical protein